MGNSLIQDVEAVSFPMSLDNSKVLLNFARCLCLKIYEKILITNRIRYEN